MSAAPQFLEIALAVTATRTPTRKSIPRPHSKPANGLRSVSIKLGGGVRNTRRCYTGGCVTKPNSEGEGYSLIATIYSVWFCYLRSHVPTTDLEASAQVIVSRNHRSTLANT